MKAPTKLRIAAIPTATRGGSAPVAIVVAIALAVSWKPLVKSKASATTTTTDDDVSGVHDVSSVIRAPLGENLRSPTFHRPVKRR